MEKELGFSGKKAIEEYGVAAFNQKCRDSVFRYVHEWELLTDRIGFWVDLEHAYVTLKNEYIESLWWILKQLWDKDLIYQGFKVVPYCPRCGTPLSDHEVALGYRETEDPSIYVKFPLKDDPATYFLVWTTTPWTLPGNVALAVAPDVDYVLVEHGAHGPDDEPERLILAKALLHEALGEHDYRVLSEMKGRTLLGKRYKPLFTFLPVDKDYCYVIAGDFVTTKEGSGIVHIAPAFGADDMNVGKEYGLPVLQTVDAEGKFINEVTPWRGMFVKDADPLITQHLQERGLMHKVKTYTHTYPFCWRCDTPLLYYAKTSWFIETSRVKDRLLANNEKINWYPEHIKYGRFGNWLANNIDWALGRERYWGTPLPVWECGQCHHQEMIGSVAELKEKVGPNRAASLDDLDLHRPYVDEVTFPCTECGGTMTARAGGAGLLVRLRGHAGGAVALSVREQGPVRPRLPGRLHLRGSRPDARLVLQPARAVDAAVRRAVLPELPVPGPDPGRRRPEDEQVARQRRAAVGRPERPRRGCAALVPVHRRARRATSAASPWTWSAKWCASSC